MVTICVFGSSSSKTSKSFIEQSERLGVLMATKGITCVNGAGVSGCMGAVNAGIQISNGKSIGVTHEMWDVGEDHSFHELLVASGENLSHRKQLLMEKADAFIALPGGCGTFDELWEVVGEVQIGMRSNPIVAVNIDGYYDGSIKQLERAFKDGILYKQPSEVLHVVDNVDDALEFCLRNIGDIPKTFGVKIHERKLASGSIKNTVRKILVPPFFAGLAIGISLGFLMSKK